MKESLDPKTQSWMCAPQTQTLLAALVREEEDARFVGGAVRNALLRREVRDIDIATPLLPDEVIRRIENAGLRAVPTGVEHGTVTAVVDGKSFEITTLRRDVATDGRHATIVFSKDWKEDAARRDFTINALYAAPDGRLFDYFGGLTDLDAGRVRFVGDPTARIREDYLRILRLFRFHAWYGKGPLDQEALSAAGAEKAGLERLSGERIQSEMLKLLEADDPAPMLRTMAAAGILPMVVPGETSIGRLERLIAIDAESFFPPDAMLRLAALLTGGAAAVVEVAERWKLSGAQQKRLDDIIDGADEKIVSYLSVREVRKLLYRLGPRVFKDLVFLRWADDPKASNAIRWRTLLAQADAWARPKFPLTGRDVMLAGVPEGPIVGRVLAEVEEWWIDADFTDDEFSLAERLKAVVQGRRPTDEI